MNDESKFIFELKTFRGVEIQSIATSQLANFVATKAPKKDDQTG